MSFTELFNHEVEAWKLKRRIKPDKQIIQATAERLDKSLERSKVELGRSMEGWDEGLDGDAIAIFKENMEDAELHRLIQEYPDLMQRGIFGHSYASKRIFTRAAIEVRPDDVMNLTRYIIGNRTFRDCVAIQDNGSSYLVTYLAVMAEKCPADQKVRFYYELDSSGMLSDLYKGTQANTVARFVINAFEGRDTDEALNMLEHSNSWRDYPKTQELRDALIDYGGERLLPALQYKHGKQ